MNITNLSQFKKWLIAGNEIEFVENKIRPELAKQTRKVNKVQTNRFTTLVNEKDCWLDIPKAKDLVFNDDGTIDFYNIRNDGKFWLKIKPIVN